MEDIIYEAVDILADLVEKYDISDEEAQRIEDLVNDAESVLGVDLDNDGIIGESTLNIISLRKAINK